MKYFVGKIFCLFLSQQAQCWLPNYCLLCKILEASEGICEACYASLPWQKHCCPSCAVPMDISAICGRCLLSPPVYDAIVTPFIYIDSIQTLVSQLKFSGKLKVANILAYLFVRHWRAMPQQVLPELLLPVPLYKNRLRERGFNQSLEIAKCLAKFLLIPLDKFTLIKTKPTVPQAQQDYRTRLLNVKNSFGLKKNIPVHHVGIVDDVITTGSTANEIAKFLKNAGVKKVSILAIARTAPLHWTKNL